MNTDHSAPCVAKVPIFQNLTDDQLTQITEYVQHQTIAKGTLLAQPSKADDALYIVHQGRLKLYQLLGNGNEQLIRILTPGDFTGENNILHPQTKNHNYIEALSDAKICQITNPDFIQLITQYPEISLQIISHLSNRLTKSENQTAAIANNSIASRIALYLVALSEEAGLASSVELPMARKELASYLGTTPESITRNINKLTDCKLIMPLSKQRIKILDFTTLQIIK